MHFTFFAEIGAIVASVGLTLASVLVLRNPHNRSWMKSELVGQAVSLLLVAIISSHFVWAMESMVQRGLPLLTAGLVAPCVFVASAFALWKLLNMGERLRLADNGHSPFRTLERQLPESAEKSAAI